MMSTLVCPTWNPTEDQESINLNVKPDFEVQDDGIIEYMHNINIIMAFPDEVIQVNKQTGQIVPLCNIVCGPMDQSSVLYHNWSHWLYQTMALRKHLICVRQMTFGYSTGRTRELMIADE
jgi:hypothetical protein